MEVTKDTPGLMKFK